MSVGALCSSDHHHAIHRHVCSVFDPIVRHLAYDGIIVVTANESVFQTHIGKRFESRTEITHLNASYVWSQQFGVLAKLGVNIADEAHVILLFWYSIC
jgi:hypothetical protein